jgi:hypothetical protein
MGGGRLCIERGPEHGVILLKLTTEKVMHGQRQIVQQMKIRTLCSRFSSLQQKESCMGGGKFCTE